ncbi:MAG: succinylglutamate desuccinylase/aspartoacylase family protein [Chloroflexi bacterium]|nr:succinylglutamate desuccinylase/aspartoacylase family protein [Chloroflexota bacterium]
MTAVKAKRSTSALQVGQLHALPGKIIKGEIDVARLPTDTWVSLPVALVNGKYDGRRLVLCAGIHGDEVSGVEIIRQVLSQVDARKLRGSIVAVPIVNIFGFIQQSRYLPDRRDLNRSFPGSPEGSLAARIAYLFMRDVITQAEYLIDLHTGSDHRTNLPQIRADLTDDDVRQAAIAFGAPVMVHARIRDGSLREAATRRGAKVLLYEAGEALRLDQPAIRDGVAGVFQVLKHLDMYEYEKKLPERQPIEIAKSTWLRAGRGGLLRLSKGLGDQVVKGTQIGIISDVFGDSKRSVRAKFDGIIIGLTRNPLVNRGDAVVHLGQL